MIRVIKREELIQAVEKGTGDKVVDVKLHREGYEKKKNFDAFNFINEQGHGTVIERQVVNLEGGYIKLKYRLLGRSEWFEDINDLQKDIRYVFHDRY